MNDYEKLPYQISNDLGLNKSFTFGQTNPVSNCWHFTTDGRNIDAIFCDEEDFIDGMNRIYVSSRQFNVTILAFCLMDTHIHFILYGNLIQCKLFIHDYVRRTSAAITRKYRERHKFKDVPINHQAIDTDLYLKTAICYVLRNPQVAGLKFNALDYPWSSGALMFRRDGYWTSPTWEKVPISSAYGIAEQRSLIKTRTPVSKDVAMIGRMIFPGEYVNVTVAECIFRTPKSFAFHMGHTKEAEVESRGGIISTLSIPIQEMRQHKIELCQEMFGTKSVKSLNIDQRIRLAKTLKSRYNSSTKQIAALCGLIHSEVEELLR